MTEKAIINRPGVVDALGKDGYGDKEINAFLRDLDRYQLFDFSGNNCNDYEDRGCKGWDGIDKRCECGNRRVCWQYDNEDDVLYAEAY